METAKVDESLILTLVPFKLCRDNHWYGQRRALPCISCSASNAVPVLHYLCRYNQTSWSATSSSTVQRSNKGRLMFREHSKSLEWDSPTVAVNPPRGGRPLNRVVSGGTSHVFLNRRSKEDVEVLTGCSFPFIHAGTPVAFAQQKGPQESARRSIL
jgi:hypothetical protein